MDELHRRLIPIGLDTLGDDFGYALAGGYAVQVHQIVHRVSDDVDLFAPINRASGVDSFGDQTGAVLGMERLPKLVLGA